jgi:hypothetical protein
MESSPPFSTTDNLKEEPGSIPMCIGIILQQQEILPIIHFNFPIHNSKITRLEIGIKAITFRLLGSWTVLLIILYSFELFEKFLMEIGEMRYRFEAAGYLWEIKCWLVIDFHLVVYDLMTSKILLKCEKIIVVNWLEWLIFLAMFLILTAVLCQQRWYFPKGQLKKASSWSQMLWFRSMMQLFG